MSLRPHPKRKSIRLPADAYLVPGSAWLVTIGTQGRAPVLADQHLASDVAAIIRTRCAAGGAVLDVYCLMPDHAHLLLQVTRIGLVDVVGDLKSCSTRAWWRHGGTGPLRQRSFHDRGIRSPAEYERAAAYVLDNPVRADLVDDWSDYPFSGGLLVEPSPGQSTAGRPHPTVVGEAPVASPGERSEPRPPTATVRCETTRRVTRP